jgi:hypothetical protein
LEKPTYVSFPEKCAYSLHLMRASFGGVGFTDEVAVLVRGQHEAAGFHRFVGGAAALPLAARTTVEDRKDQRVSFPFCLLLSPLFWRDIEPHRHDHPGEGICRLLLRQSRLQ